MSDKKLSLEHIIRNIASGNFTPSDNPKITLEHAIKKVVRREESSYAAKDSKPIDEKKKEVMPDEEDDEIAGSDDDVDESVGFMGTDKYQGSQFKSVRSSTPHIKPPGPMHGHSQAPENVSRQRTIAKEKSSMTMRGKVTEAFKPKDVKTAVKGAEDMFDLFKNMVKAGEKDAQLPVVQGAKPVAKAAEKEVEKQAAKPSVPQNLPSAKPVEPKPEVATQTTAKPEVKTEVPTGTAEPTGSKLAPAAAAAGTAIPVVATAVKMATPASPKTATGVATEPKSAPKVGVPTGGGKPGLPLIPPAGGMLKSIQPQDYYNALHHVPVKTQVHFAKKHRMHEESKEREEVEVVPRRDAGDRKKLEYVGRPKTKQDILARNAAAKTQVIDEGKKMSALVKKTVKEKAANQNALGDGKTKVFTNPPVVINPNLNRIDLNVAEGVLTSPATLSVGSELPGIYDLLKRGEYKKALNATGAAVVGGLLTKSPGIGTALATMAPDQANAGEDEFARQKEMGIKPPPEATPKQVTPTKIQTPPPLSTPENKPEMSSTITPKKVKPISFKEFKQ
jgi:hypothetical protein